MNKWVVGLYDDDRGHAFIGVEGGSICWVDDLTDKQAWALADAYNQLFDENARMGGVLLRISHMSDSGGNWEAVDAAVMHEMAESVLAQQESAQ